MYHLHIQYILMQLRYHSEDADRSVIIPFEIVGHFVCMCYCGGFNNALERHTFYRLIETIIKWGWKFRVIIFPELLSYSIPFNSPPPPPPPPPPPLVPHICVSESGQHWFRQWLAAYSAPSLCLSHWWGIVNWRLGTIFSEILIKIRNFSFTKKHKKILSVRWWPFCPKGDDLRSYILDYQHHHMWINCGKIKSFDIISVVW